MAVTITSWNVNSVRLRLPLIERFIAAHAPDVLCFQETKVIDEGFPRDALAALGYRHTLIHGMKSYNGVAILSRLPMVASSTMAWCGRTDCRHAVAEIAGIELHNLYVPAGGDIPDPVANDKFAHKLDFLRETAEWFAAERRSGRPMLLMGDLNVAPLEEDVWSHKALLKVVSHTPIEVEHLERLQASASWVDAVRHFMPSPQKLYSWWSYRARDWDLADKGRRLDHIWATPPLVPALQSARIDREVRGWAPPSDHVPVTVTLAA